ncbi:hypothetical protein ARMSODRAFT_960898 [Armillaria solidipes]|uniref:Uncharacterized protein n=1 Tax=Armillaria solidipes TaxID=1076256 RepID=A0A2H3B8H7_9AGAR|nr:hypothetical protein ARMSODRAFT_960898 [Armillaria solidipes]
MSSSRFSFPDADTSMYSSDGIHFRLRRINITLKTHIPLQDDPLPESSRILELLFKFLSHSRTSPSLCLLFFSHLPRWLTNLEYILCKNALRPFIPTHSNSQCGAQMDGPFTHQRGS